MYKLAFAQFFDFAIFMQCRLILIDVYDDKKQKILFGYHCVKKRESIEIECAKGIVNRTTLWSCQFKDRVLTRFRIPGYFFAVFLTQHRTQCQICAGITAKTKHEIRLRI